MTRQVKLCRDFVATALAALSMISAFAAESPATDRIGRGLQLMNKAEWKQAIDVLTVSPPASHGSMGSYLLTVCHSKEKNIPLTLSHGLAALASTPALVEPYATAARRLVLWAGVELSRPATRVKYEMSNEEDASLSTDQKLAKRETVKKQSAELAELKRRANALVKLEQTLALAKFDICWEEASVRCGLAQMEEIQTGRVSEGRVYDFSPPEVPIP